MRNSALVILRILGRRCFHVAPRLLSLSICFLGGQQQGLKGCLLLRTVPSMTHLQIRPYGSENETWDKCATVGFKSNACVTHPGCTITYICLRIHHDEDYPQQDVTGTSAVEIPLPKFPMQHDDLAYQKKKITFRLRRKIDNFSFLNLEICEDIFFIFFWNA